MWQATPMWPVLAESDEWKAPRTAAPGKRFAEPDEVARVVLFLASDDASYVNAACVAVDAGYTA
jgi:3-oxoacyl-[acyl-carrier protein] reductase